MMVRNEMIGGAMVTRGFSADGTFMRAGSSLSREQVLAIPASNRQSLIDNGYIAVYPPAAAQGQRFTVSRGFGKFDVIQGTRLNSAPLTKDEANALAGADAEDAGEPPVN